jgi:hypothetical protein
MFSDLQANITSCQLPNSVYTVDGFTEFVNPPLTGTLIISVNDGVTIYDTIINLPFVSPANYSISNIPSNGNGIDVSAVFSDDLGCVISVSAMAPSSCLCVADIGTFTSTANLSIGNSHFIINNDPFTMTGNQDHTFANVYTPTAADYNPAMGYLAFSCLPTTAEFINDPCYVGILGSGPSYGLDCASFGFLSNPTYIVPITLYDSVNYYYSSTNNPNYPCYDTGIPQEVYCLSSIIIAPTSNPADGTIDFQLSGALPEVYTSNYTISNVLPATASIDMTSVPLNGTVELSGLLNNDAYSFTITDDAGSELLVSNTYLSIGDYQPLNVSFYPNPVTDILNVKGIKSNTLITVTSLAGQVVLQSTIMEDGSIDMSGLDAGVYIVTVKSSEGSKSFRSIKK